MRRPWIETRYFLQLARGFLAVVLAIVGVQERGLNLIGTQSLRHGDAKIVAAALDANCDVLPSADMQHGTVVERRLRIESPFRA